MVVIRAEVIAGRSLGRKIGFPTANLALLDSFEIEDGVYASTTRIEGVEYKSISNVGVKPTVGGAERALECHILDFSGNIYGKIIEVTLHQKLRCEQRFESIEALKDQIELDIKKIRNLK